ncbi:MAG: hypothetical protein FWH18_02270 [Marinilabiliaceae bacterium]|nr:hypothetical protein [Marinilabiliaceae bacterium]
MILRAVHNTRISAFVVSFFILILLWLRLFLLNTVHITTFNNPSMPLWETIIEPLFGYSKYYSAVLSLILTFFIAFSLNRIILKFGLLQRQSMLPFVIFSLLSCAFLSVQKLNPIWIFTLFFILGIEQIFLAVGKQKPQVNCFNASLLVGIGALFYAKGVFLFVVFFVIVAILRVANFKSIIALLLGLMFPFLIQFSIYYFTDNVIGFFIGFEENILSNSGQYNHGTFSRIYFGVMIFFNVISIILSFRYMQSRKILARRCFRCFTWIMFLICAAILTPFFATEIIPVIALISTPIVSLWIDSMRKIYFQEIVTTFLIVVTILGQIFLN